MTELFNAAGRISRESYQSFFVSIIFLSIFNNFLFGVDIQKGGVWVFIGLAVSILVTIMVIFIGIKRCHDMNLSGWHYLKLLIPIFNLYFLFVLLFTPGTPGENQYGKNPNDGEDKENAWYWAIQYYLFAILAICALYAVSTLF